jgi:ABC-type multidrug transport system fused ATPase/permease subunit
MDRDYLWHINPESQETILKVMDRHRFSHYTLSLLLFYSNFVICICLFASLSFLEPALTFTVFAIFGSAALFLNRFFRRMADRSGAKSLLSVIEENRILTTLSRGIREIIIHRAQPFVDTGLSQVMFRGLAPRVAGGFLPYMPQQILESLGFATIVVMIVGMLALKLPMEEIVQTASLLMLTAWRILPAMSRCLTYSVELRRSRPVVMAYFDIWDDFLSEAGTHQPVPDPDFVFSQNLTLRDASFRYNNDFTDAISGVNLTVPKGSKVGLLGPSGSGKTSLALIMAGLVPPTEGEFLVDGKPLTAARREAYFRILGFVPQNPLILDGTLAENVAFSDWGSAGDEARVRRALKSVAADFVDEDPSGIEMLLSSAFRSLSGGQIQRVAIARAIYSDPQVIIFDEATSSLDHASENLIRRNLEQAGEEVTTVVITHSLSTVEFCDVVYWMEGGRIIRSGPPSEIIPLYVRDAELE